MRMLMGFWVVGVLGCGASAATVESSATVSSASPAAEPSAPPSASVSAPPAAEPSASPSASAPAPPSASAPAPPLPEPVSNTRSESAEDKIPGANLSIANATTDGLKAEQISCRMEGAMALLGAVLVTAWMAPQKSKLDACGPAGTKVRVAWKTSGGRREFLTAQGEPKLKACVEKALAPAKTPVDGHCAATIVLGSK